jgi:hypothetical protein
LQNRAKLLLPRRVNHTQKTLDRRRATSAQRKLHLGWATSVCARHPDNVDGALEVVAVEQKDELFAVLFHVRLHAAGTVI